MPCEAETRGYGCKCNDYQKGLCYNNTDGAFHVHGPRDTAPAFERCEFCNTLVQYACQRLTTTEHCSHFKSHVERLGIPLGPKEKAPEPQIPTDRSARKEMPLARGLLDYFPLACLAVANCSFVGNEQHNPGEPMHWAREKSTDQADCVVRHLLERGKRDSDGVRHSAKVAWRALANLQLEIEADGGNI